MSTSLARRERADLCDPRWPSARTRRPCARDWTAKDLVTHLLVRENRPLGAAGIAVPALPGLTERDMATVGRQDFGVLVEKLRHPRLTPYALPPVDRLLNTLEYVVHHEDLRRAQPGWEPRALASGTSRGSGRRSRSPAGAWCVRPACRWGSGAATPAPRRCCAAVTTRSW